MIKTKNERPWCTEFRFEYIQYQYRPLCRWGKYYSFIIHQHFPATTIIVYQGKGMGRGRNIETPLLIPGIKLRNRTHGDVPFKFIKHGSNYPQSFTPIKSSIVSSPREISWIHNPCSQLTEREIRINNIK